MQSPFTNPAIGWATSKAQSLNILSLRDLVSRRRGGYYADHSVLGLFVTSSLCPWNVDHLGLVDSSTSFSASRVVGELMSKFSCEYFKAAPPNTPEVKNKATKPDTMAA